MIKSHGKFQLKNQVTIAKRTIGLDSSVIAVSVQARSRGACRKPYHAYIHAALPLCFLLSHQFVHMGKK